MIIIVCMVPANALTRFLVRSMCIPSASHRLFVLIPTPAKPCTDVDVYAAAGGEATLLAPALAALQLRVDTLLEEWDDNPLLLQLGAIAIRLHGMGSATQLKVLMTGLELLLARAQVWEEGAARHVKLAAELDTLSALALRWRKMELQGWSGMLDRLVQRSADGMG